MPSRGFLTLPFEIRLAIYKKVYPGARLIVDITKDDNDKFTMKRTKSTPCVVNAAFLGTCSSINIEAFPIMAGGIDLAICFGTEHWTWWLDLSTLTTLSYAPSFLSRMLPHVRKLTYSHYYWNGCCSGFAAFPNLQELRVKVTVPMCDEHLPHLHELVLCDTTDADAILASAACDEIMFQDSLTELRGLVEMKDRNVKIYLQAEADFEYHCAVCTAAPEVCLCRREEECPDSALIALGFEVELGTKQPVLADKWLICDDGRYDSYEEFSKAVQDWQKAERARYSVR